MKYKLVIFDLDGTILDTLEDLAITMNHVLAENGMPVRSDDEIRLFTGNGIRHLVKNSAENGADESTIEKMFNEFNEYYRVHCYDHTRPYEGVIECMEALKKNGTGVAVVSNKADYAVQGLCSRFFEGRYDFAVGEKKNVRRKPYPDSVLQVLEIMGIRGEDAVYIGDSEVDIKTAANAGIDEIAVDWGFRSEEHLREQGACLIAHTPQELMELLG